MTEDQERARRGQRVLVLWLCWLVLALFLVAAGVVAWSGEPPPPPTARTSGLRSDDLVRAEVSVDAGSLAHGALHLDAPQICPDRISAGRLPPRQVHTQFRSSLGGFAGSVEVTADGVRCALLDVHSSQALAFEVPGEARAVHFAATGWRPVAWLADRESAPTTVTFRPDAMVELSIRGCSVAIDLQWQMGSSMRSASRRIAWDAGASPPQVDFPSGHAFRWQASWQHDGEIVALAGDEPGLHVGERRAIVLDAAAVPRQCYRLVGVSAALLPHVALRAYPPAAVHARVPLRVALGADGAFTVATTERCDFVVDVAGDGALREQVAGDERLLRPSCDLVGFCWREPDGALRRFSLHDEAGRTAPYDPLVHVFARPLGERLFIGAAGDSDAVLLGADVPTDADLVDVGTLRRQPLARLEIEVVGSAPPRPATDLRTTLLELDGQGTPVKVRVLDGRAAFAELEPGRYRLRWSFAGGAGPWLHDGIDVQAGQRRTLQIGWPPLTTWTGEVLGHADAPPERRFASVRLGRWEKWFDGPQRPIDADGAFTLTLLEGQEPEPVVQLRWGLTRVGGQLVQVDRARHHLVVRPEAGLRWVSLQVEGLSAWRALFDGAHGEPPAAMLWSHEQRPLAIAPGKVLAGSLYREGVASLPVAWIELDGSREDVVVRVAASRTVVVHNRAAVERTVGLVGPSGQWGGCLTLAPGSATPVAMPFDTRGILLADGETVANYREVPVGPAGELSVD